MSAPDLDAIQARLDAATPGPWEAHEQTDSPLLSEWCIWLPDKGHDGALVENEADAELIAHAPADLAALLAEVKRLTAERDEARAALETDRG